MAIQLTIIGLERIGCSIGLALKEHTQKITRVGHDRKDPNNKKALELGAIDKATGNIKDAVVAADIVILAVPVDEIKETIEVISNDLKAGAVLLDTSILKNEVAGWVKEFVPEDRYFVSFQPTLNPLYLSEPLNDIQYAHADLFHKSMIVITSPPKTDGDAIKLASDLAFYLGSSPYFADPHEVDGITTGTEILPELLASTYINLITSQPGWREGQKIASHSFADLSGSILNAPEREMFGQAIQGNKDNTIRMLNEMMIGLRNVREIIENEEWDELHKLISLARERHGDWLYNRNKANWENSANYDEIPSSGDFFLHMIGFSKKKKSKPE